jgi:multidrug efflux pump subunit AcrB
MWIVKLALNRPYTFIVMALAIFALAPVIILRTPTDIFPAIDVPVISVAWQYAGLNPEDVEGRLTTPFEKEVTTLVDDIEHTESISISGQSILKIYMQPGASIDKAAAQITGVAQEELKKLPVGILPPQIIYYSATDVPVLQLTLSGKGLSEQQLNDFGLNSVRPPLGVVHGVIVPNIYGGKQRSIMVFLDADRLRATGLAPTDVLNALAAQNVVEPAGTAKIGMNEYDVILNAAPRSLDELANIPIKQVNQTTVYLHDVAYVSDANTPQTNIVRQDGQRCAMIVILKTGNVSTLDVVRDLKAKLVKIRQTVPPELQITPSGDQSIFVLNAIHNVLREGVVAAALTALLILLFLGSWRSTLLVAISIPLAVLSSLIVLGLIGQTINIMALGGLALAVGILVDDATVEVENINRNLEEGKSVRDAILDGAAQIAVPAFVSTLCICIVFLPMFFLSGVPRSLFVPLAEAVIFAMLASYILSRTLVPTLAMYLLRPHHAGGEKPPHWLGKLQQRFENGFERARAYYRNALETLVRRKEFFVPLFLGGCALTLLLLPFLGQNFFPSSDNGVFILHMRTKAGTRIEETARLCDQVDAVIRQIIPEGERQGILDNIGLPYSTENTQLATSGVIGSSDADIRVTLSTQHRGTTEHYVNLLRKRLPQTFPDTVFYFLPSDIVTQILNFGNPAPIDIQIDGPDSEADYKVANQVLSDLRSVPGLTDLRIHQPMDYPVLRANLDRTQAIQAGYTARDVAGSVVNMLSGSTQLAPQFYLNPKNNNVYPIVAQTPQYNIQSPSDLAGIPISSSDSKQSEILGDVAQISRGKEMQVITHTDIRRTVDIYGAVAGNDLGAVGRTVEQVIAKHQKDLPRGNFISLKGQVLTMRQSFSGILAGLAFAILLVYLLIVVNFQSWLDPFIIITALPAALAGIVLMLFLTRTTLSVPALMGAIMCVGVATANSILVISFAKERLEQHGDAFLAAVEAGSVRFRPVIMTACAMIIGMLPMALGFGQGGEQNAPLGRAVIGGLAMATVATLTFVPAVFSWLHQRRIARAQHAEYRAESVAAGR